MVAMFEMLTTAAVHEGVATLRFTLKKEQEKVMIAFTQRYDVFLALSTGFGKSFCYCCLPYSDKLRGFTNQCIAVVVSPLKGTIQGPHVIDY